MIVNGNYREYKLNNGLVVALQDTPTQTVVANLRVNYGASHEGEGEEGLAHFIEHCLVSGGSEKFDPITADHIRTSFGYSNAGTNAGRTSFFGQMLSEDLGIWLEYTSDHVFKPRFDPERVNSERERILREISDERGHPSYTDHLSLNKTFYRGHPKGIVVSGNPDVVRSVSLEKLASFHRRGYHPNNMDLIIVGGLPENLEEMIESQFGKFQSGENMRRKFPELAPLEEQVILHASAPEMINRENRGESSAALSIRYNGPSNGHEDEYAVRIMNQILGSGTNSLLFKNVSLKKGLAYDIGTFTSGYYNAGEMGVSASVHATRIDEAVGSIFSELERMKAINVDQETLEIVKRTIKYNFAKAFETNEGHASAIGVRLDEDLDPDRALKEFDRVTPEKILEVSNKYLPERENGKYILYIRDPLKEG